MEKFLITGGAGFVGSFLARHLKKDYPAAKIVALDNLRRRGSELNLPILKASGVEFRHGDIRNPSDLEDLGSNFDLLIEASAEPSVLSGIGGSPAYVVGANLSGTLNCLEWARRSCPNLIFLSTSRVYSIAPLKEIALNESNDRFELAPRQTLPGVSEKGISEGFPTHLPRSYYGATKLASELMVQEYASSAGIRAVINRCGVIAGPGQFGKVDQGVFTLWVAHHWFGKKLGYTGFGGTGKQVRDLLHPADLYRLLRLEIDRLDKLECEVFNVGGGRNISTSLKELTALCQVRTGRSVEIAANPATNPVDIPHYVSDCAKVEKALGWKPALGVDRIVGDIADWIKANEAALKPLFCES